MIALHRFLRLRAARRAGAVMLILAWEPIHSALSLIVVMVALAGLYLLLGAEFVAAVQIIVYGGAIMVLFVFVIMLLNAGAEERTSLCSFAKFAGLPLAVLCAAGGRACFRARQSARCRQWRRRASQRTLNQRAFRTAFSRSSCSRSITSFLILVAILGAWCSRGKTSERSSNFSLSDPQRHSCLAWALSAVHVQPQHHHHFHVHRVDAQRREPCVRRLCPARDHLDGLVFVLFVIVVAAAEAAVGLSIIIIISATGNRSTSSAWTCSNLMPILDHLWIIPLCPCSARRSMAFSAKWPN